MPTCGKNGTDAIKQKTRLAVNALLTSRQRESRYQEVQQEESPMSLNVVKYRSPAFTRKSCPPESVREEASSRDPSWRWHLWCILKGRQVVNRILVCKKRALQGHKQYVHKSAERALRIYIAKYQLPVQ